jgi:hypothetical protein
LTKRLRVSLRPLPTTTSGELIKLRMMMQLKHSLDWLLPKTLMRDLLADV